MGTTLYYNCQLFDGAKNEIQANAWFLVDETGKIKQTGTQAAPEADQKVDLQQKFVMPGLIN